MFDVGDLVRLAVTNRDDDGNPVEAAGAVTVAVTRPDGTAATGLPAVQHTTPGLYWIDFPSTQAGRHLVRWTAAGGAGQFAFSDVLNVWPADPRFLLGLGDARAALGRSANRSSTQDDDIRLFMAAVTPVIEDVVGPLVQTSRTVTYDGDGRTAILLPGAVLSATVRENGTPATDITVDTRAGIVYAGGPNSPRQFISGRQNVEVTYTVGAQAVTANVVLAAREELRFLWDNAQGAHHSDEDDAADMAYTRSGYAVPASVLQLLTSTPRMGGFA